MQRSDVATIEEAHSLITAVIHQSPNMDTLSNKMTLRQSTRSVSLKSLSKFRSRQRSKMNHEGLKASESSVEYVVGEDGEDVDMESDCEEEEDSSSSESDVEFKSRYKHKTLCPSDPDSDGGSNSSATDISSEFPNSEVRATAPRSSSSSMCASCGRGPFRSMKLHLWHCSGVKVKYPCSMCNRMFLTENDLKEHYMPLYSCKVCGQVFSHEGSYHQHQCPKDSKLPLVLFCSETMPKVCSICKSFFTSDTTLLNHVTNVHSSVVSTKICIITNPSALTDKSVSPCVHGTTVQSDVRNPNQVSNGKSPVDQTFAGSQAALAKPSHCSPSLDRPSDAPSMMPAATSVKLGKGDQPPTCVSAPLSVPPSTTDTTPVTEASDSISPPMPTILAMFKNDSHDVALMKRMNTSWRAKVPYSCRQCGAILRQPSFMISHRYLHRGRRFHQCQCGRAFKHRLHLLRHCVQHAEAVTYICVSCGETFIGARHLAEHIKGKSQKKVNRSGRTWKRKVKQKCRMPFICDCGQLFLRPSAYIWHQLQNWAKINN